MSWLNRVRNSLSSLGAAKEQIPDNLWIKCPNCGEMLFTKDYEANLSVCPRCDHHGRIGTDARLSQILTPVSRCCPARASRTTR
jgi:acetyl-CoA carboxylase carboxyl transferase subunit beta